MKRRLEAGAKEEYSEQNLTKTLYRPYVDGWLYLSGLLVDELGKARLVTVKGHCSRMICINAGERYPFVALATHSIPDLHLFSPDHIQYLPVDVYSDSGERRDNITDWALKLFQEKYGPNVAKLDIFHYVYGVLHSPAYRAKYEQNLKRDLPRVPLYDNFARWRDTGKLLMELHIGFEAADPWPLTVRDNRPTSELLLPGTEPKSRTTIRIDKEKGTVLFGVQGGSLTLEGFPPSVWEYKLGHRSAVEWVLDQYADYTPKDPTVAAKFHTYRLVDHLDAVIGLLGKVAGVSVATMVIVKAMEP